MIQPRYDPEPPLPIVIEPMTMAHLRDVYAIEKEAYPRPWPLQSFIRELTENQFAYYTVALHNETLAGYCGMWLVQGEAHITNVATAHSVRRRKVAEQLFVQLLEHGLLNGMDSAYLEVRRYNTPAQLLYARYGFTPIQVRERYYADNEEDAIVLRVAQTRGREWLDRFKQNRDALRAALRRAGAAFDAPPPFPEKDNHS